MPFSSPVLISSFFNGKSAKCTALRRKHTHAQHIPNTTRKMALKLLTVCAMDGAKFDLLPSKKKFIIPF